MMIRSKLCLADSQRGRFSGREAEDQIDVPGGGDCQGERNGTEAELIPWRGEGDLCF